MEQINWTNKNIKFRDIRLQKDFYIITLLNESNSLDELDDSKKCELIKVKINSNILNARINEYFFNQPDKITRDNILNLRWNLVLTKGYFYKVNNSEIQTIHKDPDEWYISLLDINSLYSENLIF